MSVHKKSVGPHIPAFQADAVLSQASPVSGTKYTVLAATTNMRLNFVIASVTWTVQPNPIEIWLTVDGQSIRNSFTNPVSNTVYITEHYPAGTASSDMILVSSGGGQYFQAFLIEGRSVKVEAETTGGTVSSLDARARHGKW